MKRLIGNPFILFLVLTAAGLLWASLRILEVLSGHASVDSVSNVTFGAIDQTHSLIPVPRTQRELEREYFAVLYADDSNQWHLAGFPIGEEQYQKWVEKFWVDERERMGMGPKQHSERNESPNNRSIRVELVAEPSMPISYFVDRMPDDGSLPRVPKDATGVVVAKVRLQQAPSYLGGRDQSGEPPKNLPKDIFFTRLKINDVLRGEASVGQIFDVRFGLRGDKRKLVHPYTPDQLDREYVVVMYLDAPDGRWRLAPFSITELQYSQWEIEQSAYTRLRGKPGSRE